GRDRSRLPGPQAESSSWQCSLLLRSPGVEVERRRAQEDATEDAVYQPREGAARRNSASLPIRSYGWKGPPNLWFGPPAACTMYRNDIRATARTIPTAAEALLPAKESHHHV